MNYKLFDDFITLQAILKEFGIIQSGGAIKAFLQEKEVYVNHELEQRRGRKLRMNDQVYIPELNITIAILQPKKLTSISKRKKKRNVLQNSSNNSIRIKNKRNNQ